MKHYKCQNCGASLVKKDEKTYHCEYCKHTYEVEVADKVYETACKHIKLTTQNAISEALLEQRLELIANARKNLYMARRREFISNEELKKWSNEIRKYNPYDVQANFFMLASDKRWGELNKYLRKINAKDNIHLIIGFVTYLTSGQFIEKCILTINDAIASAIPETSPTYKKIHEIIAKSAKVAKSGIFDENLPRDVFVAYSSKDKEKAYELVEYLEERGINCFISMRNLPKGVDAELLYNERLKRAMDNCQVFLFVSSKNSRSKFCDAYNLELQYIKEKDIQKSGNENYYRNNYQLLVEKNRGKCKPRIEYLIEGYGNNIYENQVKQFFSGLSWCTDKESVKNLIERYINEKPTQTLRKFVETTKTLAVKPDVEPKVYNQDEVFRVANGTTELNGYRFQNMGMKILYLPESLKKIEGMAFKDCPNLEIIIFNKNGKLTEISGMAFKNCPKLKRIELPGRYQVQISGMAFKNCPNIEQVTGIYRASGYAFANSYKI